MPTLDDLIKRRTKAAEKAHEETSKEVRALQALGYIALIEWILANVTTTGGRIDYNSKNLAQVTGFYRVFSQWQQDYKGTILGSILNFADKILNLNRDYFESFDVVNESIPDKARRLTLERWGYDGKNLIPGGYLEGLFQNQQIAQRLARLMNQAILHKMPLKDFQSTFRSVFVAVPGQGMLERHWATNSFDLCQRIDRTAQLIYAEELGLTWAIYSGTLEEDSRPFCIERVNLVYSRPEIEAWKGLEFAGKPKIGYDPLTDCGGYNCRHHLSWISDELATMLKAKQK